MNAAFYAHVTPFPNLSRARLNGDSVIIPKIIFVTENPVSDKDYLTGPTSADSGQNQILGRFPKQPEAERPRPGLKTWLKKALDAQVRQEATHGIKVGAVDQAGRPQTPFELGALRGQDVTGIGPGTFNFAAGRDFEAFGRPAV